MRGQLEVVGTHGEQKGDSIGRGDPVTPYSGPMDEGTANQDLQQGRHKREQNSPTKTSIKGPIMNESGAQRWVVGKVG